MSVPLLQRVRLFLAAALALALTSACTHVAPRAAAAPSNDQRDVVAVVDRLFAAMRSKDTAQFRQIFEPGARLVGLRTRPTGEVVVQSLTWERFAAFVATDKREWIERSFDPEVRVRGTLATVWTEYDFHFGDTPSHCGVDAVHLIRIQGQWRITGIADTYETTGCPTRPAPVQR